MWFRNKLKRVASRLSPRVQNELKRIQFARQIRSESFYSDEIEYSRLVEWVSEGDWVLDVGANIGHYTMKLSTLVGQTGRVIAFEPVPATFELLAANIAKAPAQNITIVNAAASESTAIVGMDIPTFETGLDNYYMAHISKEVGALQSLSLAIDSLNLPETISLAKIDAEGHELAVLKGMAGILERCRPVLIVEDNSPSIGEYLNTFGYLGTHAERSSNTVFQAGDMRS